LVDFRASGSCGIPQKGIQPLAGGLVAEPWAALVGAERFEAPRPSPRDPRAGVTQEARGGNADLDAKLGEERLDTGRERFTRTMAWKDLPVQYYDAQPVTREPDGGR